MIKKKGIITDCKILSFPKFIKNQEIEFSNSLPNPFFISKEKGANFHKRKQQSMSDILWKCLSYFEHKN